MDIKLIMAIITITLALIFYTIGVFSERKSGTLKKFHVIIFWIGLLFDTTGTTIMSIISNGGSLLSLHAVWATRVFIKKDKEKLESFHKFSIVVWLIWLVPYILGMIVGMSQ